MESKAYHGCMNKAVLASLVVKGFLLISSIQFGPSIVTSYLHSKALCNSQFKM